MDSVLILHVVGARPNFMKVAPVHRALAARGVSQTLVHTGQHYDDNMSDVFLRQLGLPRPDENLAVGSGSHAQQTAAVLARFEPVLLQYWPDMVLVYGDVNSTLAAALVCAKMRMPVAHVEAGLRSFDRTMPEELNRLLTDQLADLLFTPSEDANQNLLREGISPDKIALVGNVMIDTVVRLLPEALRSMPRALPSRYALVTLHRPSNVDNPEVLQQILTTLLRVGDGIELFFPVHPRTRLRLAELGVDGASGGRLRLLDPLPYLEFLGLQRGASFVVTDSGGVQEETTFLGVPCLTVRENTERPVTVTCGTNIVVGRNMERLEREVERILAARGKKGGSPALWDGRAAERVVDRLLQHNENSRSHRPGKPAPAHSSSAR